MDEYLKHNHKKFKRKKYYLNKSNHFSFKNNILQFSLNAINSILINNINSSISPGIINVVNNIQNNNNNKIKNNNSYFNSINDCIDYKLKGNIYKISHNDFLNLYPNIENIISKKSLRTKKELKILKFDKQILVSQAKTPTKKISKNFYFNLMKNNNINININNNGDNRDKLNSDDKYRHSKKISEEISNKYNLKANNNKKQYYIYRTFTTINSNSKEKYLECINNINPIKKTYKKKISPNIKYTMNEINVGNKGGSKEKQNINKNSKNINIVNKKYVYKIVDSKPKILNVDKKNKGKKLTNLLKNKTKNIYKKANFNLDLNNLSSKYNSLPYNNKNINRNPYIRPNEKESPKTTRNINHNKNEKLLDTNINRNKLLLTPNKKTLNKTENIINNNLKNKNLNIKYNPTLSDNIYKDSSKSNISKNKNNKEMNSNQKYLLTYRTISNDNDEENNKKYLYKKINKANKNIYNAKTFEINNFKKKNTVFGNDGNNIFKILDNTQIIASDDIRNSLNSHKLHHFSGSNSNGNNTNQDTDYISIKNNNYMMNELDNCNKMIYENNGNIYSNDNFSFNNF